MLSKLITRHDRFHMHKILGALCLISFVYHYAIQWPKTGTLNASWKVILLHLALSCTGIQFQVPAKRIKKWPTIIWEEYRLHAIIFSFRAVVVTALSGVYRVMGICAVHLMADEVTRRWGEPGSTTVRGKHDREPSSRLWWLSRSYAFYQYLALGSHLMAREENATDLAFNSFIAVQSSAFCMTLHRKGIITWKGHAITYLICIIISGAYVVQTLPWHQTLLALAFGVGRMHGINKYPLWLSYWAILATYTPSAH